MLWLSTNVSKQLSNIKTLFLLTLILMICTQGKTKQVLEEITTPFIKLYLDMIMSIQEDVGWFQVQVEQRWVHAVQEVHSHCSLVDDAEAELPGQRLGGQQGLQGAGLHVLHHKAVGVLTDAINGQDVSELGCLHFLGLL